MSKQEKQYYEQMGKAAASQQATNMIYHDCIGNTLDLVELMYRILAKWKLIVCLALIVGLVMGAYTLKSETPMYESTATVYVLERGDSGINQSDLQLSAALAQEYIKVFNVREIHEEVIDNLDLACTQAEMTQRLKVVNDANTRVLYISFTSADANEAAAVANEYAKVSSQYMADTMSIDKPDIMSPAQVPEYPIGSNMKIKLIMGFVLGALLACVYVTICYVRDDKYKTADDIFKYTGLVNLAVVPVEPAEKKVRRRA